MNLCCSCSWMNALLHITHTSRQVSKSTSGHFSLSLQSVARTADRKLIFVPLIFMALRVWSLVVDMAVYYLPEEQSIDYRGSYASVVFGILEVWQSLWPARDSYLYTSEGVGVV